MPRFIVVLLFAAILPELGNEMEPEKKGKSKWRIVAKVLPAAALALGAALVDVGLLDAQLYRAAVVAAEVVGLKPSASSL